MLTDNGAVFTGLRRRGGRVALEVELGRLGVRFEHSRARHPQTCGKVERFQQTEKEWLAAQTPAKTTAGLHRQLTRFRAYYNDVRPHRALPRKTPMAAFAARPEATATGPYVDPHWRVRHDRIDQARLRCAPRSLTTRRRTSTRRSTPSARRSTRRGSPNTTVRFCSRPGTRVRRSSNVERRLAKLLPQAERVRDAGPGHIPHVTHPEAYVAELFAFVQSRERQQ